MIIVKRQGNRLTFEDNGIADTRTGETQVVRVPLEVLDMIDDIRRKTGLTRTKVMTELITFAYERTDIVRTTEEE